MRVSTFLLLALALCGCDGEPTAPEPDELTEFLRLVYDAPKWPEGATIDPGLPASYLGFNRDGMRVLPCVVSAFEAESLATEAGFLIEGPVRETDLYFEFDNVQEGQGYPIVRVYRSSVLEGLSLVPLYQEGWVGGGFGTLGPLTSSPVTPEELLELFDRLWSQMFFFGGVKLLSRSVEEREGELVLTSHEAVVVGGDYDACDRVHQIVTSYRVDTDSGVVSTYRFVLPEMVGVCR